MPLSNELIRQQAIQCFVAGRYSQAIELGTTVLRQDKNDAQILLMLGVASGQMGNHASAESYMNRCLALLPRDPTVLFESAKLHYHRGQFDQALSQLEKALRINPGFAPAIGQKAEILERRGDYDAVRTLLQPLVDQRAEDSIMAVIFARMLLEAGDMDACLDYVDRQLADPQVPVQERRHLHITAAKAYERLGRYEQAFQEYQHSHGGLNAQFDAEAYVAHIDELIDVFSATNLARFPRASKRSPLPVFVSSMPRSGSTLVEQILHAHPKGFGAGEITNLSNLIIDLPKTTGALTPYPHCVFELTDRHVNHLSDAYLREIQLMGRKATRVLNKQLDNYLHLGLIQLLLPGARVIHVQRDPLDNCFACFTATLSPLNHPYAGDLAALGLVYRQYQRLMRHWRAVLDIPILDVSYEALVSEPDRCVRAIVDFCGLEWDDRCLRSHEFQRDVMTISYDQVRKPMYMTSVNRARRFEQFLEPLIRSLGMKSGA